jgi:Protein of unknown function (DUF2924)
MTKLPKTTKIFSEAIHKYDGKEDKFDTRPTQAIAPDPEIEKLLKELPDKDISELREMWKKYCNEEAPNWNKSYFVPRLAYRIQEVHYATTLRPKAQKALKDIYKGKTTLSTQSKLRSEGKFKLKIGTVLERKYLGETYRVIKTSEGYFFNDHIYQYLSSVAKQITKKETKGYALFGLM